MLRILRSVFATLSLLAGPAFAVGPCPTIAIGPVGQLPSGAQQTPYSATFTASGSSATPIGFQITSGLPAGSGLSINPSTGVLSGTPTLDGQFLLTITATDQNGCSGGRTYAADIRPAVLDTVPANGAGGVAATSTVKIDFTESVTASAGAFSLDCPTGTPIAFTVSPALPANASTFTLTPNANLPQNVTCTGTVTASLIKATNPPKLKPAADYSFSFSTGSLPTITSANATTFTVGTAATFTVTTTGTPAPSIARGGVALPSGVTFTDNGNGTGTLAAGPAAAGTGGIYAITFTANNTSGSSPTQNFTLTINEAPSITSANATSFAIGSAGTFNVTTTGFPTPTITRGGVALPSNVTFTDNANGTGTLAGTPATGTGGTYAITFSATNGVGGPANQNFTFSVVGATSSTALALTTGTNPSVYGQSLTFTATVTGSGSTPTGTVTFMDGATPLGPGTLDGSGQATFTTSTLGAGPHSITAVYGGDGSFATSTSPALSQTVNQSLTTTALTTSKSPTVYGESVTFTATVAPIAPGAGTPTGTVSFVDTTTSTTLGSGAVNVSGQATLSTASLGTGAHTITATYSGDANFSTSNGSTGQNVSPGDTTTTVATSKSPTVFGESVTFTATVTPTLPSAGTPTGTVTFQDGGSTIGTGPVNGSGQATFTTSALSAASHTITAIYSGDGNFNTSTSSNLIQTVNPASTTTTLISSVNPSTINQNVTFTATVATVSPGAGVPTGTVTFTDTTTSTSLGTFPLDPSAQASVATSTLSAGSHAITATYNGAADFSGSTGGPLTQNVNLNASTTTLASSQNPSVSGQSVTLTATVSGSAGMPTGTVDFLDNGSPIATNVALVAGVATFTSGTLAVASHPLTAVYSGDPTYGGSTSNLITQVVNQADTTTTVTADHNPSVVGQMVTFTITVAAVAPGSGTPTGTITDLSIDGTTVAPPPVLTLDGSGQVTFATNTLALGSHTVTATYSGDVDFLASDNTASPLTQVVNQASTTTTVTTTKTPSVFGESVTFTATVSPVAPGGGTPTGNVSFTIDANPPTTVPLSGGQASLPTSSLSVGSHTISASYVATASYAASTSAPLTQVVNKADTTTTLASDLNPSKTGDTVTFTATVAAVAPGAGTPTGTVTFTDSVSGSLGSGALNGSGQASVSTSSLGVGAHTITASYGTSANFNGSTSSGLTQNVNQPPAITSGASTTFAPGKTGQTFTVNTTGFPTNASMSISVTSGTPPTGVSLVNNNNGTATLGGTPAALTQNSSPYGFVITASNGVSPDATQNFTLNIMCPVINVSGASSLSAVFNTAMTAAGYSQTGGNGTITWTAPGLPAGVSIDASGTISGTPSVTGVFSVSVTATDAGGCQGSEAVTFTSAPKAVGDNYSGLIDNTQAAVTGAGTAAPGTPYISLNATGTLIANDLPSGGVAATPGTFATAGGGSVTIATDGTFIYTPHANSGAAANTSDSFNYTVTSNGATSAAAAVNLTLSNRVWYVNNSGAAAGVGQSQSPFNTLAAAGAASTANDIIFVYNGNGTNSGMNSGISLKNGQQLLGEANGLSVGALSIAAGSRPTIGNSGGDGVTATNVAGVFIKGLAVAGSANGIKISTSTGTAASATVNNVIVNSAAQNGIDARTAAGAGSLVLDIDNNSVTATGSGIVIDGSVAGTTTITGFANNAVSGNTVGSGILVTSAKFDAVPGGVFDAVSGGTTVVGASGNSVGANGMVLTNVSGDLAFTDLDIFAGAGAGLRASGTTPYTGSAGFRIGFPGVFSAVATSTATGGPAVDLATVAMNNFLWQSITSTNSPTTGAAFNAVTGTFSDNSGSAISGSTATGFQVGSSNATISYAGTINTTTGKGVDLTSNTGSTISFTGALTLSSGSNTAFNATGGGTVTATNAASTLTSTTGTALNVVNTTIGASGLTFFSISANGGADGIFLDTTGSSGGLSVTGNVASTTKDNTGGTIQNMTGADGTSSGHGVYLNSTKNVSLKHMSIQGNQGDGIHGNAVNGFTLRYSNVGTTSGNGNTTAQLGNFHGEGDVHFVDLTTSALIDNNAFSNAFYNTLGIFDDNSTSINRVVITNNTFGTQSPANGNDACVLEATGGTFNATFSNNTVTWADGDAFQLNMHGTVTSDLIMDSNQLTNTAGANIVSGGGGVTIGSGGASDKTTFTFNINNNTITGAAGAGIGFSTGQTGVANFFQNYSGSITNNTFGNTAVADSGSTQGGDLAIIDWGSPFTISITGNHLSQYNPAANGAMQLQAGDDAGNVAHFKATVTGNVISNPGSNPANVMQGIALNVGPSSSDVSQACLTMYGNSLTSSSKNGGTDMRLRQRANTDVYLIGNGTNYAGAVNDTTAVNTFEIGQNGGTPTSSSIVTNSPPHGFHGACPF